LSGGRKARCGENATSLSHCDHHICRAVTTNLTDDDRGDLARFLREAIETDRLALLEHCRILP
jgi:hypothetical protein